MKKIVIVHHVDNPQQYIFEVPGGQNLKKDDLVIVKTIKGECMAVCVCDSFRVADNVLAALQRKYGGNTLRPVIGKASFTRWDLEQEKKKEDERDRDRLTEDLCIGGQHCWQVKEAGNELCADVCRWRREAGCEGCPIAEAIDKLAAYENSRVSPQELQEVVDLFEEFVEPDVPAELKSWMERCTWHVQKCNEQREEIERLKKELDIANGTSVPAAE